MEFATALQIAGTALGVIGGMNQADAMREAARANAENNRRIAKTNKQQLDYEAGQARAAAQHDAERARREAALAGSRLAALSAASGGTVDSSLMAGILARGEYNERMLSYSAEEKAKGLEYRGTVGVADTSARNEAAIYDADNRANATALGAIAGGVKGAGSIFSRFSPTDTPPGAFPVPDGDLNTFGWV